MAWAAALARRPNRSSCVGACNGPAIMSSSRHQLELTSCMAASDMHMQQPGTGLQPSSMAIHSASLERVSVLWLGPLKHSFMCHTAHLDAVGHVELPRHRPGNHLVARCTPLRLAGLADPEPDGLHRVHDLLHGQAALRSVGGQPAVPGGRAATYVICPRRLLLDTIWGGLCPCPTLCCCLAGPCDLPYPLAPVTTGQPVTWMAARQASQGCKRSLDLTNPLLMDRRHLLSRSNKCNEETDCSSDLSAPGRGWHVSQPKRTPLCHGFLEGSKLVVQQACCRWNTGRPLPQCSHWQALGHTELQVLPLTIQPAIGNCHLAPLAGQHPCCCDHVQPSRTTILALPEATVTLL